MTERTYLWICIILSVILLFWALSLRSRLADAKKALAQTSTVGASLVANRIIR